MDKIMLVEPPVYTQTFPYKTIDTLSTKIKILCLSVWYPLSISRYFEKALLNGFDVDLITTGPYTAEWIPWLGGMTVDKKYALSPDIPLPFPPNIGQINYDLVKAQLPKDWIPDVVLCIDAGIFWKYKPTEGLVVHIATDPHCLNYDYQRTISDKFFNMQLCYSRKGDLYLPYAYSQYDHYPMEDKLDLSTIGHLVVERNTDAVLIGMPYKERIEWVNQLRSKGISVIFENGPIFDEARTLYNRGRIGLNWSSLDDLNARAFELPAMKLAPVMNLVTDIGRYFEQGIHYKGFTNLQEAVDAVIWLKEHPMECNRMAEEAYKNVQGETYDARIDLLLNECGFLSRR